MCLHECACWTRTVSLRAHRLCRGCTRWVFLVVWEELRVSVDGHVGARPLCTRGRLVRADMSTGCCVKGRGSGISGGGTPGWGSGRREVSAAFTPFAHPAPQDPCQCGGRGGLCGSLGRWAWAGASPWVSDGGLSFGGPRISHPLPLPPAPAWPVQPHKALFMPGGRPRAPEGVWGWRGGSCTHGQGTSGSIRGRPLQHRPALWGWTLAGVASSPHPSSPAGRPPPQAPPSRPQLPLTPATSKETEGEPGAERGPGAGWDGDRDLGSPGTGLRLPPTTDAAARTDQRTRPLRLPSV